MEKQFFLDNNGQSLQQQDLDLLGEVSALADDRVFAELLRLAPYAGTVGKAVLTYGHQTSGKDGIVGPGTLGHVVIRPFRAFVGSRTLVATEALENWRDIRSALSVAEGATVGTTSLAVSSNATAFSRIDLVYAAVGLDSLSAVVPRKVKDPTSGVVTDITVSVSKSNTVTIAIAQGTASATPALPALPSDGGDVYYLPLAYLRVAAGFGASSALVERTDFHVVAPAVTLAPAVGAASLRGANQSYAADPTEMSAWANTASTRKVSYIPSDMSGCETLVFLLDLTEGGESHAPNDVVDDSRDWRNRITKYSVFVSHHSPPWLSQTPGFLNSKVYDSTNVGNYSGMGHTFLGDANEDRLAAYVSAEDGVADMLQGFVKIYADDTTGALCVDYSTSSYHPNTKLVFWLSLTGPL